jgi:phosphohistidine swiveling domain-containing protein
MINPKKELFKWGPIDGKVKFVDTFMEFFPTFHKDDIRTWPDSMNFMSNGKTTVIVGNKELYDQGEKILIKFILNKNVKERIYALWLKKASEVESMSKDMGKEALRYISDKGLLAAFMRFDVLLREFWEDGFIPELASWGGEQQLRRELLKHHKGQFSELLEALSAPEDLSFFQVEELELLNIKLLKDVKERQNALKDHQNNYFWLRNSYGHTEILPIGHFTKELSSFTEKQAKSKIKEIENHLDSVKKRKKALIKRYNISKKIQDISENLSFCIWWQDLRKKYLFMIFHIINEFTKEIARRKKVPHQNLDFYARSDIIRLLEKGVRIKNLKERKKAYLSYYYKKENKVTYLYGDKALKFVKPYLEVKVKKNISEIKGLVVSKGKAKGKVRILLTPKNIDRMKQGEILVAPMTSPDYIVAMRKASAIVTDEGGLTSHAAIVSRELKKPCIVSTKIATKVLKDGDLVEIDANHGTISIIKKA